jgi:hypothetical protein
LQNTHPKVNDRPLSGAEGERDAVLQACKIL